MSNTPVDKVIIFEDYINPAHEQTKNLIPVSKLTDGSLNAIVYKGALIPACTISDNGIQEPNGYVMHWAKIIVTSDNKLLHYYATGSTLNVYSTNLGAPPNYRALGTISGFTWPYKTTRYNDILYFGGTLNSLDSGVWKVYFDTIYSRFVLMPISINALNEYSARETEFTATGSGTGGSLPAGTYEYVLTYAINNNQQVVEGNMSTIRTVVLTGSTSKVTIQIPQSYNANITKVRIYRKAPTETDYYFMVERDVSSSPTPFQTWTDNGGIVQDITRIAPTTHDVIKEKGEVFAVYKDRLFFGANDNQLYFSKVGEPEHINTNDFLTVGDKKDRFINLIPFTNFLLIIKQKTMWVVSGYNKSSFTIECISPTLGASCLNGAEYIDGVLYFYSIDGIYTIDVGSSYGSTPIKISENIQEDWRRYQGSVGYARCQIIKEPITGFIWFALNCTDNSFGQGIVFYNRIMIYDPFNKKWLGSCDVKRLTYLFYDEDNIVVSTRQLRLLGTYRAINANYKFVKLTPSFNGDSSYDSTAYEPTYILGALIDSDPLAQKIFRFLTIVPYSKTYTQQLNIKITDLEKNIFTDYVDKTLIWEGFNTSAQMVNVGICVGGGCRIKITAPNSQFPPIGVKGMKIQYENVGHYD